MASEQYKSGDRFEFAYPFSRSTYTAFDDGEDGGGTTEVSTWKVGPTYEQTGPEGDTLSIAESLGRCVLTIVSIHKPGRFPTRVFFTRTWISPDGKPFGKSKCRVTTLPTFRNLASCYRHEFVIRGCACDGCRWPYYDHRMQGHSAHLHQPGAVDPVEGISHV